MTTVNLEPFEALINLFPALQWLFAIVVLICLAFLSLILESKIMILKLWWCRLSQRLPQATLANASEITRSASVQEMKYTISPSSAPSPYLLCSSLWYIWL